MFANTNVQYLLCKLSANLQIANTKSLQISAMVGYHIGEKTQELYTYWNKILLQESNTGDDPNKQNKYANDSAKAQNQENTMQAITGQINTTNSNLSTQERQLSGFALSITDFMKVIASLISSKL